MKFAIKAPSNVGFSGNSHETLESAQKAAAALSSSWGNVSSKIEVWQLIGTVITHTTPAIWETAPEPSAPPAILAKEASK